jgi:two-component system response regulator AtoC
VKVNCAALPADLLESELFGYERGAFTGALREKKGKFELADKGTILLDEIGEMSIALQAKLLHVLQDGEYPRLGSTGVVRLDTRVIATTNKNLEEAVATGEFRLDLFYRLNVIKLEIPPLRERREDIPHLFRMFLNKYLARYGRPAAQLPPDLMESLRAYNWPGNVRQLENMVKRIAVLGDFDLLLSEIKPSGPLADEPGTGTPLPLKKVSAMAAEQAEKDVVLRLLHERNWNRKQVARELKICYKSLLNKLRRWQLPTRGRVESVARDFQDTSGIK